MAESARRTKTGALGQTPRERTPRDKRPEAAADDASFNNDESSGGSNSAGILFDQQTDLNLVNRDITGGAALPIQSSHNINSASQLTSVGGMIRVSRDEMNLAEFPLTVLSKRADPSVKTLEFNDSVKGKNGEIINRAWIITGADKFGLPTSSDDEVLLGLLKLTADDGLRNRKIFFTRYELLKILRWTTEGRSYTRLQNALDRLSGVRIKASNAFYDNETKLHSTKNFGIIDAYEINDGRDTHPSFFTWSDVLFKSFQVGFIKKLDLEFYLDLKSAVSKRLYRYLDKHFWYRSRLQVSLFTLAHEKIGVSRNYLYASSLRQQLEPALEELVEKGMLSEFQFVGKGQSTEIVLIAAHGARNLRPGDKSSEVKPIPSAQTAAFSQNTAGNKGDRRDDDDTSSFYESVVQTLVKRGLAERQVRKVIIDRSERTLNRLREIVSHFDLLVTSQSHLVNKNPCGFLYRAVEKPFEFMLPKDRTELLKNARANIPRVAHVENAVANRLKHSEGSTEREHSGPAQRANNEARFLVARKITFDSIRATVSESELQTIRGEVEAALSKLKAHISPLRFQEALEHGVEKRLLDKRGFPDYDRWVRDQGK